MWKVCCCCFQLNVDETDGEDVQELDYHHASLREVPPEIFTYERTLEKLDLGSNQIADLPPSLFHCHELRELNLCDNEVKEIPAAVESLTRLAKLEISRNYLSEVPENIKNCKNLTYLDLSINTLSRLPEAICLLVNLEELFLNETNLEFLPANFGRLTKLRTLELRENLLQTLPKSMNRLQQLQKLDIGSNDIEELPEVIGTMTNLIELWADNNIIRQIPKFIGNLTKLVCLDLSKNDLNEVSSDIGKCANLEDVTLSCNSLACLSEAFTKLESVTTLRADNNCITDLPEDLGKLKNLQELSIGSNVIKSIPPSVGLLRKLHTVYMDDNQLSELPKEIGSCTSLTVLSVAQNCIMEIPSEVGHLANLKMLNLTNNSIRNLPVSILGLTNLGALWLTDGQNKPLVALNREIDSSTGQHVVTCCLLPQLGVASAGEANSENNEDQPRRSQRKIRFQNEVEAPPPEKPILNGGLLRAPTPYPKELRAMAKHASQYRQSKGQNGGMLNNQNEPMYEGDVADDVKDPPMDARQKVRTRRYNLESQQDYKENVQKTEFWERERVEPGQGMFTEYENVAKVDNHPKHPLSRQEANMESKQKFLSSNNEGYLHLQHQIGLQDRNNEPLPPIDPLSQSTHITKNPPPYHIAAQRAKLLRSSGGAGSGKMNYPGTHTILPSDVECLTVRSDSEDNFSVHGQHGNVNSEGQLPDKNANITAPKPMFNVEDTINANTNVTADSVQNFNEDERMKQELNLNFSRDGRKQSSFKESRIPTAGRSPFKTPPSISSNPGLVSPTTPSYNLGPTSPASPITHGPTARIPLRKFGTGPGMQQQFEPVKSVSKAYNSVSYIGSSETSKIGFKPSSISVSHIKQRSTGGNINTDIGNSVPDGNNAALLDGRKSRIPKFGSTKADEVETERQPPEVPDKSKIPRSGIPKLSSARDIGSSDPKLLNRKPWIFGSHKNARVESVEYRKVTQDRLGFTIDEFSGATAAPDGKGIYVTATESNDLPIKVGDKILQVDGIDVDVNNMGVAIVSKILANCQENIQFLVSRQQ